MTCPSCNRAPMAGHPGGILEIKHDHATCTVLPREDATRAADYALHKSLRFNFDRTATDAERELLAAIGYDVPDGLITHVHHVTPGVRKRTWDLPEAGA